MSRNTSTIAHAIYSGLWTSALPLVVARLWWKGRKQPEYREHLGERFGRYPDAPLPTSLWLHAVSVGETRAAAPLVQALRARYPTVPLVLTHMTPTGRATAEELYTTKDPMIHSVYLPYDLRHLHRRFIAHFHPLTCIVMETEVWPNLLAECTRQAIPVCLVNARLSERSASRYVTMGALARSAFSDFELIGAQSQADASRIARFRVAPIDVTGNIKFDNRPPPHLVALGQQFRRCAPERKVVLAASTRDGEEESLLHAAAPLIETGALLVIVPRHPQRFDDVAHMTELAGFRTGRRSQSDAPSAEDQIWIGDSMGEMTAYFAMADVTLMGGTWQPLGGQNFIESCAVGTPVLLGPSTFNFDQAAKQALDCGAARSCVDLDDAITTTMKLLDDAESTGRMAKAGLAFAAAHGGATERTLDLLHPLIDKAIATRQ